jgi:MFS family permease
MLAVGSVYGWSVLANSYMIPLYGFSPAQANVAGTMSVLSVYVTFPTGMFFDGSGARASMVLGGMLLTSGWLLTYWAISTQQASVVVGICQCFCGQAVQPLMLAAMDNVRNFTASQRGTCNAIVFTGFGLTSILMAQLAEHVFPGDLRSFLLTMALAGAVLVLYAIVVFAPPLAVCKLERIIGARRTHFRNLVCHDRDATVFLLTIFLFGMSLYYWIVNLGGLVEATHSSSSVSSLVTIFGIFNVVSRPIVGFASDLVPLSRAQMMAVGCVLVSLSQFLAAFDQLLASAVLCGLSDGWMFATFPTLTREVHGTERYGVTWSTYLFMFGIGDVFVNFVLGPVFGGHTRRVAGIVALPLLCGLWMVVAASLALVLDRRLKGRQAQDSSC